jgi:hypothetical protein
MTDASGPLSGSCLCGQVRFRIDEVAGAYVHCHCRSCRKASGSAFAANLPVPVDAFSILQGREHIRYFESSPGKRRHFCSQCGSPLYTTVDARPDTVRVRLGTVDTPFSDAPVAHIFTDEKAPWHTIHDDRPRFGGWPDPGQLPLPGSRQGN